MCVPSAFLQLPHVCPLLFCYWVRRMVAENPKTLGSLSLSFQSWVHVELFGTLLLRRCHQMDLTSGCYTVLCHCAYAQNTLTAKLQTPTATKNAEGPEHGSGVASSTVSIRARDRARQSPSPSRHAGAAQVHLSASLEAQPL